MTDRKYNLHNWTFVQYVSNSYRRTEIEVFKLDEHLSPCKLCAMPRPRSGRGAQSTDEGVYLAWTRDRFHCARKVFFRTFPSQNIFFSWEGKQNIFFLSCGTEIYFSIKTIHWLLKFSSAIFFFLAGNSRNFFSATMQIFFSVS